VFVDACADINSGAAKVSDFDHTLASIATTYRTTAILEAGRLSLDNNATVEIQYDSTALPLSACCQPIGLRVL